MFQALWGVRDPAVNKGDEDLYPHRAYTAMGEMNTEQNE